MENEVGEELGEKEKTGSICGEKTTATSMQLRVAALSPVTLALHIWRDYT